MEDALLVGPAGTNIHRPVVGELIGQMGEDRVGVVDLVAVPARLEQARDRWIRHEVLLFTAVGLARDSQRAVGVGERPRAALEVPLEDRQATVLAPLTRLDLVIEVVVAGDERQPIVHVRREQQLDGVHLTPLAPRSREAPHIDRQGRAVAVG